MKSRDASKATSVARGEVVAQVQAIRDELLDRLQVEAIERLARQ